MTCGKVVYILKGYLWRIADNKLLFLSKDIVNHRRSNKISQFLLKDVLILAFLVANLATRNIGLVCQIPFNGSHAD